MGDYTEGSGEVQEDDDADVSGVISHFNEGGLCVVMGSEAGLKRLIELRLNMY